MHWRLSPKWIFAETRHVQAPLSATITRISSRVLNITLLRNAPMKKAMKNDIPPNSAPHTIQTNLHFSTSIPPLHLHSLTSRESESNLLFRRNIPFDFFLFGPDNQEIVSYPFRFHSPIPCHHSQTPHQQLQAQPRQSRTMVSPHYIPSCFH